MDNVIVTAKMIREARERREAQASEGAFNLSKARPLKQLMAESRAKKAAAAERRVSPDKYHTLVNHDWKVKEMKSAYPSGVIVSRLPNGYDTWRAV